MGWCSVLRLFSNGTGSSGGEYLLITGRTKKRLGNVFSNHVVERLRALNRLSSQDSSKLRLSYNRSNIPSLSSHSSSFTAWFPLPLAGLLWKLEHSLPPIHSANGTMESTKWYSSWGHSFPRYLQPPTLYFCLWGYHRNLGSKVFNFIWLYIWGIWGPHPISLAAASIISHLDKCHRHWWPSCQPLSFHLILHTAVEWSFWNVNVTVFLFCLQFFHSLSLSTGTKVPVSLVSLDLYDLCPPFFPAFFSVLPMMELYPIAIDCPKTPCYLLPPALCK